MKRIPTKIKKCPIKEAVFEIRYKSEFPSEAIFGILYSVIKDFFPADALQQLPVQQIPEQIRVQDPNLKYQSLYRLKRENLSLSIGPKSLVFANTSNYIGWDNWSTFFGNLLDEIQKTNILTEIERIGLRYINVFRTSIFKNSNIGIKLGDNFLLDETSTLRTELIDEKFIKVLQVGNAVNITENNHTTMGSMIDIDCIYNWNGESFFEHYSSIVEKAHIKEKELFFNLLNEDFIQNLEPEYK